MVHDLLSVQDDRYRYKYVGNNNKPITKEVCAAGICRGGTPHAHARPSQVLLNETDSLWVKYRHMHIADLSQVRSPNRCAAVTEPARHSAAVGAAR